MTEPKYLSVEVIGAAPQSHVDDGTTLDAVLSPRVGLDAELGDAFQGHEGGGGARDGHLVQGGVPVVAVVVGDAVHRKVVGGAAQAVDVHGQESPAGGPLHPGDHLQEAIEVAPAQRQGFDAPGVDQGVLAILLGLDIAATASTVTVSVRSPTCKLKSAWVMMPMAT